MVEDPILAAICTKPPNAGLILINLKQPTAI
jgi:hypothetical protein